MYAIDDSLSSYELDVEHPGDWTFETKNSSLLIQELFSECYPQVDRLVEFFVVRFARKADLNRLVRVIDARKNSDRLVATFNRSSYLMKNCVVFGIVGDFHTSIRRLIYRNDGFGQRLSVINGVERWHFFWTEASARAVLDDLPRDCKAQLMKMPFAEAFQQSTWTLAMKNRQLGLLRKAFDLGYFDYPRGISMTQLANLLGVSKSTLSQSFRSALKELLTETIMFRVEEYA